MEDAYGYERYEEPYSYEVRDRRVRIARGLQAVDGLQTSEATFPYRNRDMAAPELYAAKGMLSPAEESSRIG